MYFFKSYLISNVSYYFTFYFLIFVSTFNTNFPYILIPKYLINTYTLMPSVLIILMYDQTCKWIEMCTQEKRDWHFLSIMCLFIFFFFYLYPSFYSRLSPHLVKTVFRNGFLWKEFMILLFQLVELVKHFICCHIEGSHLLYDKRIQKL